MADGTREMSGATKASEGSSPKDKTRRAVQSIQRGKSGTGGIFHVAVILSITWVWSTEKSCPEVNLLKPRCG